SCVVGAAVKALHIPIWEGVTQFIKLFSVSSLPLGLLCVGAALQFMQIKKDIVVLAADSFARVLAVPALAYAVCTWFGLPSLQTQILVIFLALPT
ncbi:AEC family transporter, partial [Acinetobacter baumannii]|uniref:AEC family transporter n=1 Tax=Acinetobacter baumannii TaxID=470 RepID=UPI003AF8DB12